MDLALAGLVVTCLVVVLALTSGCSSMQQALGGGGGGDTAGRAISNPFQDTTWAERQSQERVVFRSKKGSRAIEVEVPSSTQEFEDFTIPMSPQFAAETPGGRSPASVGGDAGADTGYEDRKPTATDLEIVGAMPQGNPGDDHERQQIEEGLGLRPVEDAGPRAGVSYLASIDKVNQLFRGGRYEAGLLEIDALLRSYPTDPRLYEKRGTLLERLGYHELAIRSWQQAVKLDPDNLSLKAYLERKVDRAKWRKVSSE
ncbi:MAG TPA: hypothetical protein VL588_01315 [Bdellovibrionota bacterium]|nr:hypothetical protein [Bdellovibrionota bacterium]